MGVTYFVFLLALGDSGLCDEPFPPLSAVWFPLVLCLPSIQGGASLWTDAQLNSATVPIISRSSFIAPFWCICRILCGALRFRAGLVSEPRRGALQLAHD